jgi:hypothetical protein
MSPLPLELLDIIQLTYESEDGLDPGVQEVGRCLAIAAMPRRAKLRRKSKCMPSLFWGGVRGRPGEGEVASATG